MGGTIFWVYYSLRTNIYLHVRNNCLSVLLSEDIHVFICEELFSECTTLLGHAYITCEELFSECASLWGHTYIYMWKSIFWVYYSLRTYIYLHVRNYFLSVLLFEDIHIFTWEELFSECTTLWGHRYIYMRETIFWVYYSLRTYIYLHGKNYFLNVIISEDIHIFTYEDTTWVIRRYYSGNQKILQW